TMHEVPRTELLLLALDQQPALPREHEEVLLVGLAVVHPARLSGLEHRERIPDLSEHPRLQIGPVGEHARAALEDAAASEGIVAYPRGLPHVDHEPAVAHGRNPRADRLQTRLVDHRAPPR